MSRAAHHWGDGKSPETLELAARPEWLQKRRARREPTEKLPAVIRDGSWHKTMVSAAGTLRRRGFSEEAATAALIAENGKYSGTPPPDSDGEIADLVADVYERYEPVEAVEPERAYEGPERALVEVVETFQRYLYLPDSTAVHVVLAASTTEPRSSPGRSSPRSRCSILHARRRIHTLASSRSRTTSRGSDDARRGACSASGRPQAAWIQRFLSRQRGHDPRREKSLPDVAG